MGEVEFWELRGGCGWQGESGEMLIRLMAG